MHIHMHMHTLMHHTDSCIYIYTYNTPCSTEACNPDSTKERPGKVCVRAHISCPYCISVCVAWLWGSELWSFSARDPVLLFKSLFCPGVSLHGPHGHGSKRQCQRCKKAGVVASDHLQAWSRLGMDEVCLCFGPKIGCWGIVGHSVSSYPDPEH